MVFCDISETGRSSDGVFVMNGNHPNADENQSDDCNNFNDRKKAFSFPEETIDAQVDERLDPKNQNFD